VDDKKLFHANFTRSEYTQNSQTHRHQQVYGKSSGSSDLEVSEFGEGVDDDAEDDVQSDGRHEYEERRVVDHQEPELGKRVLGRVACQILHTPTGPTAYCYSPQLESKVRHPATARRMALVPSLQWTVL